MNQRHVLDQLFYQLYPHLLHFYPLIIITNHIYIGAVHIITGLIGGTMPQIHI